MSTRHPYYTGRLPAPQQESAYAQDGLVADLTRVRLPAYPDPATAVRDAQRGLDARAAAFVMASVAPQGRYLPDPAHPDDPTLGLTFGPVEVRPVAQFQRDDQGNIVLDDDGNQIQLEGSAQPRDLLEWKHYGFGAPDAFVLRSKCLAALAYRDYFPTTTHTELDAMVAEAVTTAGPGWSGTFGPGISDVLDLIGGVKSEGNYDMQQMIAIALAYRYYDRLPDPAREHLITVLLARGRIHRVSLDDTFTSGGAPGDWSRAGHAPPDIRLGETENHQLMLMTARYLTNQLLYQREHVLPYDNRRNGNGALGAWLELITFGGLGREEATALLAAKSPSDGPDDDSCTSLLLSLLQSYLRDDFSEYNAKGYQLETRWALLDLCSYAYDGEVRLAARMVLDWVSAHVAVSSVDLRRLLPFRRRNEAGKVTHDADGFMQVDLIDSNDADPLAPSFALQAGNTRAYDRPETDPAGTHWCTAHVDGGDQLLDALGDYRLPEPIHELFLDDGQRRFFQRVHRTVRTDEEGTGNPHNVDVSELLAGSPSYLICAGGRGTDYAIDPRVAGIVVGDQEQQLGAGVTTSFLPTMTPYEQDSPDVTPRALNSRDAIQLGGFFAGLGDDHPTGWNYGVAPDFACGHQILLPPWLLRLAPVVRADGSRPYVEDGDFLFVDHGSSADGTAPATGPGFYLAVYRRDGLACLEAFDTWRRPDISFTQFRTSVRALNVPVDQGGALDLRDGVATWWTTAIGTQVEFRVWRTPSSAGAWGADVLAVHYSPQDPESAVGDAGATPNPFLAGSILTSPAEAVVVVRSPRTGATITLDHSDRLRPVRTDEQGRVERAGGKHEVWADFGWTGAQHGDAAQPYGTLAAAVAAVEPGGGVRIIPSATPERLRLAGKAMRLVAPAGGVRLGRA